MAVAPFTDPQRLFADLAVARTADGLPWSDTFQARVVGRYDDIVAALRNPVIFSSAPAVPELPSPWRERFAGRVPSRGTLLGLDNPDHDRLRAAVNTFFLPRRLARYEPWIRERARSPGCCCASSWGSSTSGCPACDWPRRTRSWSAPSFPRAGAWSRYRCPGRRSRWPRAGRRG